MMLALSPLVRSWSPAHTPEFGGKATTNHRKAKTFLGNARTVLGNVRTILGTARMILKKTEKTLGYASSRERKIVGRCKSLHGKARAIDLNVCLLQCKLTRTTEGKGQWATARAKGLVMMARVAVLEF
eukprot:3679102-Pleurochrysis_carterae.AAC.2